MLEEWHLVSPSRILWFCDRWIYCKIKQTPQFSQKLTYFYNCRRFPAYFGLRRVLWCHRNVHSVKEWLFLSVAKMEWTALRSPYARFTRATSDKWTKSGTNSRYTAQTVYLLGPEPQAALDHATPLHTALGDTVKNAVEFTAESITYLSNLVRSIQILLKLRISEQTPLMWKPGKTLFNRTAVFII